MPASSFKARLHLCSSVPHINLMLFLKWQSSGSEGGIMIHQVGRKTTTAGESYDVGRRCRCNELHTWPKHTDLLRTAWKKRKGNQYLVSKSHDWSIGRWPKSLLAGSPVGAKRSEPQQQNRSRPPSGRLHWSFPVKNQTRMVNAYSPPTLCRFNTGWPRQYIKPTIISEDNENRKTVADLN